MKLSKLMDRINILNNYEDIEIDEITDNSKKVTKGSVFVCIKGDHFDGHDAVDQAFEKGAAAVVVQRDVGVKNQIIVEDTRCAFSIMCGNYYNNPAEKMKLIGITGTNGKTTSAFLIKGILDSVGYKTGLIGTVENIIGNEVVLSNLTTPESLELQSIFAQMAKEGCEYCVMEVSSQALAQKRVCGLKFESALFTNLTQDHLDYHGDIETYAKAKKSLFDLTKRAVVNADDPYAEFMVSSINCEVTTFSIEKDDADFTAKNVKLKIDSVEYELVGKSFINRVHFGIPGRFSVYNSMGAIVCALDLGLSVNDVISYISKAKGVVGRVEVVPTNTEYSVVIDYAHTPDSLENVLKTLREFATGNIITVFGCGGDRDKTKRPKMGKVVADLSDVAVVTSDNPRTEDPEAIIEDILVGMENAKIPVKVLSDRTKAIEFALNSAKPKDIVLLAGKGHETYQVIGKDKIHYDEREIVSRLLNNK